MVYGKTLALLRLADSFIFASQAGPTMKIQRIGEVSTASKLGLTGLPPHTRLKFEHGWLALSPNDRFVGKVSVAVWIVQDASKQKIK